ncbi:MAG: hypothetical protein KatS3mg015_3222 [Fimbriimonadales bacterium]|nr:MAG: hypothetical protein KatS3mg015_3222 [Fimbriimonadales bacterium]
MKAVHRVGTAAEDAIAALVEGRGLKFVRDAVVPGVVRKTRPDFSFPSARLAVFVDGCFWHSCPRHRTLPKRNRKWWEAKLASNVSRDQAANKALREAGWKVLRAWACERPELVVERIVKLVGSREETPTAGSGSGLGH